MHIHILGICGKFMAGIAVLARQLGYTVSGSDAKVYPPMSTQIEEQGITLYEGFAARHLQPAPDLVIVGNVMSRGNPAIEYLLAEGIPYTSGPEWLATHVLQRRWVLAVAGTHGKTTTTSLLAFILEEAGLAPGFLIGGVPENFLVSARLGSSEFFVIEADEYDSAFFDKRPKFLHYHPKTLILNNLEYDHADIYPNLEAIQQQCHYLIRTVPNTGLIVTPAGMPSIEAVIQQGCWTPRTRFGEEGADWQAHCRQADGSEFEVYHQGKCQGVVQWDLIGQHNVNNALAAIAAAYHVGVTPQQACASLKGFKNVKRRMELKGEVQGVAVFDDFAHHPTAIQTTLAGLRNRVGGARILAVVELGSYTMRTGVHKETLAASLTKADHVFFARPNGPDWGIEQMASGLRMPHEIHESIDALVASLAQQARAGDKILVMSNTGFGGLQAKLLSSLQQRQVAL